MLTVPAVASKYMPGHALLMSLGSFFGAPALVPLLLTGLTGSLLFLLVRRVADQPVALLAWIVWLGDPINLRFRAGYYSEVTSSAMWLLSWWTLLEWRETRRRSWLLALAAAMGWGAITRPLTMLAFAVPIGFVVLRDVVRHRLWRDLGLALGLGTAVLGIIPLWSAKTTGDWRLTPQTLYTRDYLPFDKPGFGVDDTPPARQLLTVNRFTYAGFHDEHVKHTISNLPAIALARLRAIAAEEWKGVRVILVPFVLIGLSAMSAEVAFALACSAALFLGYLSYGHWAPWTLYYFEAMPVLSVLAALGLWRTIAWIRARRPRPSQSVFALAAALALLTSYELHSGRARRESDEAWDIGFRDLVAHLPIRAAVIFVHYAPRGGPPAAVVANSPNLANEPVWIVNDLGSRNAELMRYAGSRVPLAFHEDGSTIEIDRSLLSTPAPK